MIVRDEEQFLDACLSSARGVADEIVVLDTGSTDRTAEIARSHGARVHSHAWADSYSEARNAAIDLATGDWILILDADECLDESAGPAILAAVQDPSREAYLLPQRNYTTSSAADFIVNHTCRLWRNRPEYRYAGRVHEQPAAQSPKRADQIGHLDAIIHHFGDQPAVFAERDKHSRYIRLLEMELRDNPSDAAKLHEMATLHYVSGHFGEALHYLHRAADLAHPETALAGLVFSTLIGALYHAGQPEQAISTLDRALRSGIRHPEIHYAGGQSLMSLGRYEEAVPHFARAIELGRDGAWTGDAAAWGYKAEEAIASCALKLGRYSEAIDHGIGALRAVPDRAETRAIVADACFRLGDALYASGDYLAASEFYGNGLSFAPDHAPAFFTLGNCCMRLGSPEAAVVAYRKALELDPGHAEALNNLAIAEEASRP